MLVITRRSRDRISFPQIGVTVQFIRVQASSAKVGVDAPSNIIIARNDIGDDATANTRQSTPLLAVPSDSHRTVSSDLQKLSEGLRLYKQQLSAGLEDEADQTFEEIQLSIARMEINDVLQDQSKVGGSRNTSNSSLACGR